MSIELKEIIMDYVLSSPDNLKIALNIVSSYVEFRKKIVIAFSDAVVQQLRSSLGDNWRVDGFFDSGESAIQISKKSWEGRYMIGVGSDTDSANWIYFYVMEEKQKKTSDWNKIKELLDENFLAGRKNPDLMWIKDAENSFRNWTEEKTLVKLYEKDESALEYLKKNILKIKDIVEPEFDELSAVRKAKK